MFQYTPVEHLAENYLVIGIAPTEGITLQFNSKVPGPTIRISGVQMNFRYRDYFKVELATGYETLIYDCMIGDNILFQRALAASKPPGRRCSLSSVPGKKRVPRGWNSMLPAARALQARANCCSAMAAGGGSSDRNTRARRSLSDFGFQSKRACSRSRRVRTLVDRTDRNPSTASTARSTETRLRRRVNASVDRRGP
jgi:hypothetical protein